MVIAWVEGAVAHDPRILGYLVEWKTCAHDRVPRCTTRSDRNGFVPEEPESIMIGAAAC